MSELKTKRLPPLNAIKAFEAAAKTGSLSSAGQSLFVSPAAVSQQVKLLEDHLNVQLFNRTRRGVELTEAGQLYLTYVHESFEKLRIGQQKVEQLCNRNALIVTAIPSFASKWLMPKMFKWMEINPELEMRIEASNTPVNFNTSNSDFSICFGDKGYPGLRKKEMFRDTISPVCSPEIAQLYNGDLEQLLQSQPLIHIDWGDENVHLPGWDDWLQHAGMQNIVSSKNLQLNYSSMAIEASVQSKGIMLGQATMVQEELQAGKLVRLSDIYLPLNKSYYLVYPKRTLLKPMAAEFLNWLNNECEQGQQPNLAS